MSNRKIKIIISLLCVIIFLTFGMLVLNNRIKINGRAGVLNSKWDVYFTDLNTAVKVGDAVEVASPTLNSTKISNFFITLRHLNDSISYTFSVVNDGDYNAKIDDIVLKTPTCLGNGTNKNSDEKIMCSNVIYKLTYENGTEVKKGDYLFSNETKKMNISIEFTNNESSKTELPKSDVMISDIELELIYVQS